MRYFSIVLLLVSVPVLLYAQQDTIKSNSRFYIPDRNFWGSCLGDGKKIVTFPVRWNGDQWAAALITAGITSIVMVRDGAIQKTFDVSYPEVVHDGFRYFIEPFGSGIYSIPALVILYGSGALARDRKLQYVALKGTEAFLYSGIIIQILKQVTHRHRPNQDVPPDPWRWEGPIGNIHYTSFPSGHSAGAFAVATVISMAYQKTVWVPLCCYSLASLVAVERLVSNEHWASDVIVGAAVGIGIGLTIAGGEGKRIGLLPVSPSGPGITMIFRVH